MILVSACLLGENCKYNGGNNHCPAVLKFLEGKEYIFFCPELAGGLSAPRPPVEIQPDGRAVNLEGDDVTEAFQKGAADSLALCQKHGVDLAILKERSPSCGVHLIYDGSFCGVKIPGQGMTAKLLKENGVRIISEFDL